MSLSTSAKPSILQCETVTESDIWSRHGTTMIWHAKRFVGTPMCYPVYRYQDYYSYSVLALLLHKGYLLLHPQVKAIAARDDFLHLPQKMLLDVEIERVGGPLPYRPEIASPEELAGRLATAIQADTRNTEEQHPGHTNVILCGGKDSLNMLLVPWNNETVIASAPPNYQLVKQFVQANKLPYDVVLLDNDDDPDATREVSANCCRINLEHCRWLTQLTRIAEGKRGKVIWWIGAGGDWYLTPKWKDYCSFGADPLNWMQKLYAAIGSPFQWKLRWLFGDWGHDQRQFSRAVWVRGAMWQGVVLALMREVTGALALSAYHGPSTRQIWATLDIAKCVQADIRPLVGNSLKGAAVTYPETNPSPPCSASRKGISGVEQCVASLRQLGVEIRMS